MNFTVDESEQGMRLEKVLARRYPSFSRAVLRDAIRRGWVRVKGRKVPPGYRLVLAQEITLSSEIASFLAQGSFFALGDFAGELPLQLVYQDEQILVVHKPAGLPVHPLRPWEKETLAHAVCQRYPEVAKVGEERAPGLVHRLDNDTSGLVLFAREQEIWSQLRFSLQEERWEKIYLAWVRGELKERLTLGAPLAHDRQNKARMVVAVPPQRYRGEPRPAATQAEPLISRGGYTLLQVSIQTGVRHQIRIHLADAGFPIVGDRLYGASAHDPYYKDPSEPKEPQKENSLPPEEQGHGTVETGGDFEGRTPGDRPPNTQEGAPSTEEAPPNKEAGVFPQEKERSGDKDNFSSPEAPRLLLHAWRLELPSPPLPQPLSLQTAPSFPDPWQVPPSTCLTCFVR